MQMKTSDEETVKAVETNNKEEMMKLEEITKKQKSYF